MSLKDIYKNAGVVMKPAAMKDGKLYSQQPHSGAGDFNFSRADGVQTRINKHGLIETVADNEPRLSYSIVDGKVSDCPHLLLEPSRTNYVTYSNDISGYGNFGSADSDNATISPDGSLNASLVEGDGSQIQVFLSSQNITLPSSGSYTVSVFAKKGGSSFIQLIADQFTSATNTDAYFDLENGTTPTSGAKIEDYGNGWYKCSNVVTIASGDLIGRIGFRVTPSSSAFLFSSASASSGKNVYVYGFQMEQGSYPTSYIPTSGSTETRQADICNGSGNSETFNDSEGVLYAEIEALADDLTNRRLTLSDGTDLNRMALTYNTSSNTLFCFVVSNNTTVATLSYAVSDTTQFHKVALKYKQNDFALWVDGFEVVTDLSGNTPIGLDELKFEQAAGGNNFYGKTKQLSTFKTALTDSELEKLTSWESFFDMAKGQEYNVKL